MRVFCILILLFLEMNNSKKNVYTILASYSGGCGFSQVAKRKIYRHYKFKERLCGVEETYDFGEPNLENVDIEQISFDEFMITKETVQSAISYLKNKDELTKKIFYLYYFMDKSIKEIADLFSVKESNVKNKLYRTLKEIRQYLLKEGME